MSWPWSLIRYKSIDKPTDLLLFKQVRTYDIRSDYLTRDQRRGVLRTTRLNCRHTRDHSPFEVAARPERFPSNACSNIFESISSGKEERPIPNSKGRMRSLISLTISSRDVESPARTGLISPRLRRVDRAAKITSPGDADQWSRFLRLIKLKRNFAQTHRDQHTGHRESFHLPRAAHIYRSTTRYLSAAIAGW